MKNREEKQPTKSTVIPDFLKRPVKQQTEHIDIAMDPANLSLHSMAEAKLLLDLVKGSEVMTAVHIDLQKKLNAIIAYFKSNDRTASIRRAAAERNERTRNEHKE